MNNKQFGKYVWQLTGVILCFNLSACSSLTHNYNQVEVKKVKKVAVVAFSLFEPAASELSLTSGKGLGASSGGSLIPQKSPHVDLAYDELGKTLAKNMGWQVVGKNELSAKPGYIAAYDKTMKGWQNKVPPGQGMKQFNVEKIMDSDGSRILDFKGRDELIAALGVDAIITTRLNVQLNGTRIMGIGNQYPQTTMTFMVHVKGVEAPVWFEGLVKGDEMSQSVGKTGFFDEKLLAELALKSARTAFSQLGSNTVR